MQHERTAAGVHDPSRLPRFHVVLVQPEDNLNIGAVARAMMNLGFEHLHLVQPKAYDPAAAARTACWAAGLLERVRIHASLEEAVAPMHDVIGFSARHSKHRRLHMLLPEWSAGLSAAPPAQETALLFGREQSGLSNSEITCCRALVRIPSSAANPSYNLAQAVLLALYEITRAIAPAPAAEREAATANDLLQLDRLVGETLETAAFYREDSPSSVPRIVSNLLRRAQPDKREAGILLALFSHLNGTLRRLQGGGT